MSLRPSSSLPSICSGDMYWNVPTMVPSAVTGVVCVAAAVSVAPVARATGFAKPKSRSFAPVWVSMMLPGFKSRWYDTAAMRFVERVGDLGAEFQNLIERERAFFKTLARAFRLRRIP